MGGNGCGLAAAFAWQDGGKTMKYVGLVCVPVKVRSRHLLHTSVNFCVISELVQSNGEVETTSTSRAAC